MSSRDIDAAALLRIFGTFLQDIAGALPGAQGDLPRAPAVDDGLPPAAKSCLLVLSAASIDLDDGGEPSSIRELCAAARNCSRPKRAAIDRRFADHGLRLLPRAPEVPRWLAVAHWHSGLAKIFESSEWHSPKAGRPGHWIPELGRLPGALSSSDHAKMVAREAGEAAWRGKRGNLRFGKVSVGALLLPIELFAP